MENLEYKKYLNFAIAIAKKAGRIMRRYWQKNLKENYKNDKSIVTIADEQINNILIKKVQKKYKLHAVLGEENSFGKSKYTWVCDPVDGTAMYARNIPVAVFSLALTIKGDPVVAVVYNPWQNKMYTAIKNEGAFLNKKPIKVNNLSLKDNAALINYDIWNCAGYNIDKTICEIRKTTYCISMGSCVNASMNVANGNFVAHIFPAIKGKCFDVAAAKLIVEEAGGVVRDFNGKNQRYDSDLNGVIISNKTAYKNILNIVKNTAVKL